MRSLPLHAPRPENLSHADLLPSRPGWIYLPVMSSRCQHVRTVTIGTRSGRILLFQSAQIAEAEWDDPLHRRTLLLYRTILEFWSIVCRYLALHRRQSRTNGCTCDTARMPNQIQVSPCPDKLAQYQWSTNFRSEHMYGVFWTGLLGVLYGGKIIIIICTPPVCPTAHHMTEELLRQPVQF